jgi:hypothetical protein
MPSDQQVEGGVSHITTIQPHQATGGAVAVCTCGWKGTLCSNRAEAEEAATAHRTKVEPRDQQVEQPTGGQPR